LLRPGTGALRWQCSDALLLFRRSSSVANAGFAP